MDKEIIQRLEAFIKEDIGTGDITSESIFSENFSIEAFIIAKQKGIFAGGIFVKEMYRLIDENIKFNKFLDEGEAFKKNQIVGNLIGPVKSILKGERAGLNLLSHISAVATFTNQFVQKTKDKISILDTRKTLPGLRFFEKYGVRTGGGKNHRMKMDELILIKDNHINIWMKKNRIKRIEAIKQLTALARKNTKNIKIEVEVESYDEAIAAYNVGVDILMFDNTGPSDIKKFLKNITGKKPIIEISGGINLKNIKKFINLPVDWISSGTITNSAPAIDFSLEIKLI
jgi:nicotinate-nucleotide pyrophosphorylase (carboxylating)